MTDEEKLQTAREALENMLRRHDARLSHAAATATRTEALLAFEEENRRKTLRAIRGAMYENGCPMFAALAEEQSMTGEDRDRIVGFLNLIAGGVSQTTADTFYQDLMQILSNLDWRKTVPIIKEE